MPNQAKILVTTVLIDIPVVVCAYTTGKEVFDKVTVAVGLREVWYFGLRYTDSEGQDAWINLGQKLTDHDIQKNGKLVLHLRVRLYPENVADELIEDITKKLFFLEVKESILSGTYHTPPEIAFVLAVHAAHARYGAFNHKIHKEGFLRKYGKVLPDRITNQLSIKSNEWEEKILALYEIREAVEWDDGHTEYLKLAQDLPMFGMTYFVVSGVRDSDPALLLGVDPCGLHLFSPDNKWTPLTSFHWGEIFSINGRNCNLSLSFTDDTHSEHSFRTPTLRAAKRITALCKANQAFFKQRRGAEIPEIPDVAVPTIHSVQCMEDTESLTERQAVLEELKFRKGVLARLKDHQVELNGKLSALQEAETKKTALNRKVAALDAVVQGKEMKYQNMARFSSDLNTVQKESKNADSGSLGRHLARSSKQRDSLCRDLHRLRDELLELRLQAQYAYVDFVRARAAVDTLGTPKHVHLIGSEIEFPNDIEDFAIDIRGTTGDMKSPWAGRVPYRVSDERTGEIVKSLKKYISTILNWEDNAYRKYTDLEQDKYKVMNDQAREKVTERLKMVDAFFKTAEDNTVVISQNGPY